MLLWEEAKQTKLTQNHSYAINSNWNSVWLIAFWITCSASSESLMPINESKSAFILSMPICVISSNCKESIAWNIGSFNWNCACAPNDVKTKNRLIDLLDLRLQRCHWLWIEAFLCRCRSPFYCCLLPHFSDQCLGSRSSLVQLVATWTLNCWECLLAGVQPRSVVCPQHLHY